MILRILALVLGCTVCLCDASAQTVDLYRRFTDPRGIARFDGPDTTITRVASFHSFPWWNIDPTDKSGIVAQDSGSGVITHIWTTASIRDSDVYMRLYLNDTLILADYYEEFFDHLHGRVRPPLDTLANGARTWDVQIPYHNGFKLTVQSTSNNLYYVIEWHRVEGAQLPWFHLNDDVSAQASQLAAERSFHDNRSPWHDANARILTREDTLRGGTQLLADLAGPAMIQELRIRPSTYDFARLDSVWLNVYWDRSPTPAIHAPLLDFFLCPNGISQVRSRSIKADADSGFQCFLPMPFATHARVELVQMGTDTVAIASAITVHSEPIDKRLYGYLHADFSESNTTKYHVNHEVVHTLGRGRYIGLGFGVYDHPFAVFLEGDPMFTIDSVTEHYIRYTGGEDYFDAAWWFPNGMYSLPFSGLTHYIDAFYRFHYLDCYEFQHSFDFSMQPGGNADIYDRYRTVGYYYLQPTSFWADRDTIRPGEIWNIGGAGYSPQQKLVIWMGNNVLSATATDSGTFDLSVHVPGNWRPGIYPLSINGEISPRTYFVLGGPAIRCVLDTLPLTARAGDSVTIVGTGFVPGERVAFYLDSIPLKQYVTADSSYGFRATLRVPYLAERSYLIVARGERSGNAAARDLLHMTRQIILEFEDLMPPIARTPGECWAENVSYFWEARWSKQMFVYFKPDTIHIGASLTFGFNLANSDTFHVQFRNSIGKDLGMYTASIDGVACGTFDGYQLNASGFDPLPSPAIELGTHYLAAGSHRITFTCLGKQDSAKHDWLEPDNLILTPTTVLAAAPGTLSDKSPVFAPATRAIFYPNPASSSTIGLALELGITDSNLGAARVSVAFYDERGTELTVFPVSDPIRAGTIRTSVQLPHTHGALFAQVRLTLPTGAEMKLPVQTVLVP